jgi:hypothetical protein
MAHTSPYSNPAIIGPGVWWSGHMLTEGAVVSQDPEDYKLAYGYIMALRQKFTCLTCLQHTEAFCKTYPLEQLAPSAKPDYQGLATWFYKLHANTNTIIGKHNLPYEDVQTLFRTDAAICTAGCGAAEQLPNTTTVLSSLKSKTRPRLQRTETRGITKF